MARPWLANLTSVSTQHSEAWLLNYTRSCSCAPAERSKGNNLWLRAKLLQHQLVDGPNQDPAPPSVLAGVVGDGARPMGGKHSTRMCTSDELLTKLTSVLLHINLTMLVCGCNRGWQLSTSSEFGVVERHPGVGSGGKEARRRIQQTSQHQAHRTQGNTFSRGQETLENFGKAARHGSSVTSATKAGGSWNKRHAAYSNMSMAILDAAKRTDEEIYSIHNSSP
eukprot:COSAG05_NODE_99_length_19400_cov_50.107559_4_plen_223_part_00